MKKVLSPSSARVIAVRLEPKAARLGSEDTEIAIPTKVPQLP